jgi:hypothetical protein
LRGDEDDRPETAGVTNVRVLWLEFVEFDHALVAHLQDVTTRIIPGAVHADTSGAEEVPAGLRGGSGTSRNTVPLVSWPQVGDGISRPAPFAPPMEFPTHGANMHR